MEDPTKEKIAQLEDYIMKNCLWQFHSRAWDRERQNREILLRTTQLLCDEPTSHETMEDKCYWVDAVCLADAFKANFAWLREMSKEEVKDLMKSVKDRIDQITYKGSLNKELTDQHY